MQDVFDARAIFQKALVLSVDDTGQTQVATVKATSGAIYSNVEVIQPFGMASVPPGDGAVALLFAIGGDPANLAAILTNPSVRFGNQAQGESALYAFDGTRVAVRQGGTVEVWGGNEVIVNSPSVTVTTTGNVLINAAGSATIAAAGGVTLGVGEAQTVTITGEQATIQGNLQVNGNINTTGNINAAGTIHG